MMVKDLVSIIVPVYNVESYIDECIESLIKQTYNKLEIILVDDGSTDNSSRKCDEWGAKDNRIKVVHKANGGLSSARNTGIEVSNGEYIGFVDSDDYVTPDMFKNLYDALNKSNSFGFASGGVYQNLDGKISIFNEKLAIKEERVVPSSSYAVWAITGKLYHMAWNKLFRRDFIGDVRFELNKLNEDTLFSYEISKVMESSKLDMIEIPQQVYYYRTSRPGSICNSKKPLLVDIVENLKSIISDFKKRNDDRWKEVYKYYCFRLVNLNFLLNSNATIKEKYYSYYEELVNLPFILTFISLDSYKQKVHYVAMKFFPSLYFVLKKVKDSMR